VVAIAQSADFGLCLIQSVSLSDYYCLPNKLFEYAFAGVPVLASNFPDLKEIVQTHGLGLVSKVDVHSLINAIKQLENQESSFGFKNLFKLSWKKQEEKLLALYEDLFEC